MSRHLGILGTCAIAMTLLGCASSNEAEKYGKTFYLDGAGNWGPLSPLSPETGFSGANP